MNNKPVINIRQLEIGYKHSLTNPVELSANSGELICILGKNGTGKSTLLKTLAGIIKPLAGEIFIIGINQNKLGPKNKSKLISFVPSRLAYMSNIKVIDLVSMGRTPYTNVFNNLNHNDLEQIDYAIELFGLQNLRNRPLFEVSDGERQKAMICRAYVQNTPVIMLDEPTAFLDYPSKVELIERLKSMTINSKKTIIFSSHDLELSLKNVEKLWIFDNKTIIDKNILDLECKKILNEIFSFTS